MDEQRRRATQLSADLGLVYQSHQLLSEKPGEGKKEKIIGTVSVRGINLSDTLKRVEKHCGLGTEIIFRGGSVEVFITTKDENDPHQTASTASKSRNIFMSFLQSILTGIGMLLGLGLLIYVLTKLDPELLPKLLLQK